jgi:hypothetical protein
MKETVRDAGPSVPARSRCHNASGSFITHIQGQSLMSGQAEQAFVKAFANILASQPVTFNDDFQEEPEKTLKRVPVLQVCVCAINRQFLISR